MLERWADTLLAETERNASPEYVDRWAHEQIEEDPELTSILFQLDIHAHLSGQLFIRDIEVPELGGQLQLRRDDLPFVALPFMEAIRHFVGRDVLDPDAFYELQDLERMRSFTVSRAMAMQVSRRIKQAVGRAITEPEGPSLREFLRTFLDDVDAGDLPGGARGYLANVFRTTSATSYNAGRYTQQTHPDIIEAGGVWRYVTASDERVRDSHEALHGAEFPIGSPQGEAVYPPNGFNCFDGSTRIGARVLWVARSLYSGEFLELATEGGATLTVTANHPLLTPHGFVAAHALAEGDDLLRHEAGIKAHPVGDVHVEQRPPRIDDLWDALRVRGGAVRFRPGADDLHGDAAFIEGDVHVVSADRELLRCIHAAGSKRIEDGVFSAPAAGAAALVRPRAAGDFGVTPHSPSGSIPGSRELPLYKTPVLLDASPLQQLGIMASPGSASSGKPLLSKHTNNGIPADGVCPGESEHRLAAQIAGNNFRSGKFSAPMMAELCATPSHLDAVLLQQFADPDTANPVSTGDHREGLPSGVSRDRIVSINRFWARRHVYDLQSDTGLVLASQLLASNCRCVMVVVDPEDARGTRVDPAEVEAAITDGFRGAPGSTIEDEATQP